MDSKQDSGKKLVALARARGWTPGAHRVEDSKKASQSYAPKTLRDHRLAIQKYQTFNSQRDSYLECTGHDPETSLQFGAPAPDLATVMDFLRFHAASGRGVITSRITVESANTFMEWFLAGFEARTGNVFSPEFRHKIYELSRTSLVEQGDLIPIKKEKFNFTKREFTLLMRAFWTMDDDDVLMHPRNKVQIPFLIWLYCWTGARIGAFFPKEKEGKKGLRYRDLRLVMHRSEDGTPKLLYKIDQRYVKNNKNPEHKKFGACTYQHDIPLFDDSGFLIAICLADGALDGITTGKLP
ncbi:hypothetical protein MMC10_002175 [Thelotrema lepadinum]|nr:hypothetical protein [Thelotrema lepadinum]